MRAPRAERAQVVRRVQQVLDHSGPARRLVERETLGGTAARHQNPVEPVFIPSDVAAAFAVRVHIESHARLDLRKDAGVLVQLDPQPRRPDVVAGTPDPPTAPRFTGDERQYRQPDQEHPGRHTRPHARNRGSNHDRTSIYGSLRQT